MDSSEYSEISETDTEKKTHKCTVVGCRSKFSKCSKLIIHLRKHAGERPFKCNVGDCKKSYTNSSHLIRHNRTYHEKRNEQVICDYEGCGKSFSSRWTLKRHKNRKHNPNRQYPFKCFDCNQGFFKKRQLIQHQFIHTGQAPFRCDICEKGFVTFRDCNKHKKNHNTYSCECGEVFGRWTLLLRHRKTCRIEKVKCDICEREFATQQNLQKHLKTHTVRTKEFTCQYENCSRSYFHKKNLQHHIQVFHEKKYENNKVLCTFENCSTVLKTNKGLKQHIRIKHSEIPKPKLPRKPRCDKGIRKKAMAAILSGVTLSTNENKCILSSELQKQIEAEESEATSEFSDASCNVKIEKRLDESEDEEKFTPFETDEENDLINGCKVKMEQEFKGEDFKKSCLSMTLELYKKTKEFEGVFIKESRETTEDCSHDSQVTDDVLLQKCDDTLTLLDGLSEKVSNEGIVINSSFIE